jgi:hypothetical protein
MGNLKEIEVGDVKLSSLSRDTVTDIDPNTGTISWDVDYIPNLDKLLDDSAELVQTAKGVYTKEKNDSKFADIYQQSKSLRNVIRTHVRNNYPEEYRQSVGVNEEEIDETSTSGGAGSYLTPYAFRLPGSKANDKAYTEIGYEPVKEDIGADLGPGPKASNDGVKGNAYVKQFAYKLIPKKIKNSGLEVKQLFEDSSALEFQQERIAAFDSIEQELNNIYKMLSNAKNETADYYSEKPASYSVVKPTDLILDYIKDIKDLLKGE